MMRIIAAIAALVIGGHSAAIAQNVQNISSGNPAAVTAMDLSGKQCVGQFQVYSPKGNSQEQGAIRISLAQGGAPSATFERAFGLAQYKDAQSVTQFDPPGAVSNLKLTGNRMSFTNAYGVDWIFEMKKENGGITLVGSFDPKRANPGWVGGYASARCR